MITIIKGESFPIPVILQKGSQRLGPDDVEDIRICVAGIHKKYSARELKFDEYKKTWRFYPSQEDTLKAVVGIHEMQTQIKYPNGEIRKIIGPYITVKESPCKELI